MLISMCLVPTAPKKNFKLEFNQLQKVLQDQKVLKTKITKNHDSRMLAKKGRRYKYKNK